jgi:hypothetical protein
MGLMLNKKKPELSDENILFQLAKNLFGIKGKLNHKIYIMVPICIFLLLGTKLN